MADIVNGVSIPFLPIGGFDAPQRKPQLQLNESDSFGNIFAKELDQVQFSKHAQTRMDTRNIQLGVTEMAKLNDAMNRAESKGAQDALILLRDMAFIVNIPNRTVVTTMTQETMKEHVFTKIDSAIIAD